MMRDVECGTDKLGFVHEHSILGVGFRLTDKSPFDAEEPSTSNIKRATELIGSILK